MNILFRVDASDIIGTGHVYRCLNFAQLYSKKHTIYFVTKKHLFNLNEKIKEKYTCFELENENLDNINLNIDSWLGESEMNDVKKTISVIKTNKLSIDWLIIDHYAINETWENEIRKYVKNICVIDDFTNRKHNCNILINQQINDNEIVKYKNNLNADCKICVGNDYLLLNHQYYQLNINKNIEKLKRINIFMGGSDIYNISEEIIDICYNYTIKNNLNIIFDVIIGKSNKNAEKIKNKINDLNNFHYYYDLKFIGDLLLEADLAIGLVLAKAPVWQMLFSYVSAGYMIWLALKSWPASDADTSNAGPAPDHFRFRNGLFVHPLNPKAWVMCVLAWGKFAPALGDFSVQLPVVILTFAFCQLGLHSLWCWLGTIMGKSLRNNVRLTRAMIISTVIIVLIAVLF